MLVVTSGGPIQAVEARLQGLTQAEARSALDTVANCSLVEVAIRDAAWNGRRLDFANPF